LNVKPLVVASTASLVAQAEIQTVQLLNTTGGTFTLSVGGSTSTAIPYNAPATEANKPAFASGGAVAATGGGTLAAGTYYYVISAMNGTVESVASAEQSATLSATGTITLTWTLPAGSAAANGYRVYRSTTAGAEDTYFVVAAGLTTIVDNGSKSFLSATPASQSVQRALTNMSSIGPNGATVTGTPGSWTVTFTPTAPATPTHVDKLTGDPGALLNANQLPALHVTVAPNSSNTTVDQLVAQIQLALDAAAVQAGITVGFTTGCTGGAAACLAASIAGSATQLAGGASSGQFLADDQAFQIQLALTKTAGVDNKHASFAVTATAGNFAFGFGSSGKTTPAIAIGSSASVVQSALTQLLTDSALTGTVTVTQAGNSYAVAFSDVDLTCGVGAACLMGGVLLGGTVAHTHEATQAAFDTALQTSIRSVLKTATRPPSRPPASRRTTRSPSCCRSRRRSSRRRAAAASR
jgi:hypothetical protein